MKLSEIIKKYEPLGWKFNYTKTTVEDFWVFRSPRMDFDRGFREHKFDTPNPELFEVSEEKMLDLESEAFIRNKYDKKISNQFQLIKEDIIRQMIVCDKKRVEIPQEFNISFDLNLK